MSARTPRENTLPAARSGRGQNPLSSIHFKKGTPRRIASEILSRYGKWIQPEKGLEVESIPTINADAGIEFAKTALYKEIEARLTPGKWVKNLREANGYSQSELGKLLGEKRPVRAARISDWECDFRAISKPVAKRLAALFHVSADRFI